MSGNMDMEAKTKNPRSIAASAFDLTAKKRLVYNMGVVLAFVCSCFYAVSLMLFSEKKAALELLNALEGTERRDEAILASVESCVKEGILEDFLRKHGVR
ncbi:hypothetical protein D3Z38_04235 [Clostridiales bacterium]|nr:hypothetical protein [Clostridiales bacterium]